MDRVTCDLPETKLWRAFAGAALLSALFFGVAALLRRVLPDLVRDGSNSWLIEAWAGATALALLVVGARLARRTTDKRFLLPLACALLVGLAWLAFVRQDYGAKWDFNCYLKAGLAVRHGINIYDIAILDNYRYLYSPLLATIFSAAELLPQQSQADGAYWVWSIANFWAIITFMLLLVAVLRRYALPHRYIWPVVAAALLCNVPLQRTIVYSQVNLHVLNLILGFVLLYRRRPGWAGVLLAGAVLLKSSPILLLLPVLLERRWRIGAGFLAGGAALVGGSIALVGVQPWRDFTQVLDTAGSHGIYRDNSIQSLIINLGRWVGAPSQTLLLGSILLTLLAAAGLIRLGLQPRCRRVFTPGSNLLEGSLPFLLLAMLLASPRLWEHHWLFAQLAFLLLAVRAWGTRWFVPALLCYGLVFWVPVFDVFPFSYHRLFALGWWVVLVRQLAAAQITPTLPQPEALSSSPREPALA